MTATSTMRDRILDVAQELVQTLGYDGFSFADVADGVGIRKASIHHHFATKSDLGVALVDRFRRVCRSRLETLASDPDPIGRLGGYVELFRGTLAQGRMCLCGILAAGFASLSGEIRGTLLEALAEQENWVADVLRDGQERGLIRPGRSPDDQARSLIGSMEGALLLARVHSDPDRFESAVRCQLDGILAQTPSGIRRPPDKS